MMTKNYGRLRFEERIEIEKLLSHKKSYTDIALALKRSKSPTNENSNGVVRDYFPADTDFNLISAARLKEVQNQLNERPRHVLDYRTPKEVFEKMILKQIA